MLWYAVLAHEAAIEMVFGFQCTPGAEDRCKIHERSPCAHPPAASRNTLTRPFAPPTAKPSHRPRAPNTPARVSRSHCTLQSGPPSSTRPVQTHSRRPMSQTLMRPDQSVLARRSPVGEKDSASTQEVWPRSCATGVDWWGSCRTIFSGMSGWRTKKRTDVDKKTHRAVVSCYGDETPAGRELDAPYRRVQARERMRETARAVGEYVYTAGDVPGGCEGAIRRLVAVRVSRESAHQHAQESYHVDAEAEVALGARRLELADLGRRLGRLLRVRAAALQIPHKTAPVCRRAGHVAAILVN